MTSTVVPHGTAAELAETAFAFASELGFTLEDALHVDVLALGEKSTVYRVSWRTPLPGTCIFKRFAVDGDGGRRERSFYENVSSQLSVRTLRCFGSREDRNGALWLALEDAGDTEPALEPSGVRALLTEWTARLHMEGAGLTVRDLPDAGPAHFARRLAEAEARLRTRLAEETLGGDGRDVLASCVERCRELRSMWPRIEETCSSFPWTLVHGDLVEESLRLIPAAAGGRELVPLDWEQAGRGVPAVDLVRVDPEFYWQEASRWLGTTRRQFDRLVLVGHVFRLLTHRWTETSIDTAESAEARLGRLLADLGAR